MFGQLRLAKCLCFERSSLHNIIQFLLICFAHTQYKSTKSDCSTEIMDLFSTIWHCDWDNDNWCWHSDDAIPRQPIYLSVKLSLHRRAEPTNYKISLLTEKCLKTCQRTIDNNQDVFSMFFKCFRIALVGLRKGSKLLQ